jgi:uncharacterized protein (TIGR03435 family)
MDWQDDEFELFLKRFRLRQPHRLPDFVVPAAPARRFGLIAVVATVVVLAIILPLLTLQRPLRPVTKPDSSARNPEQRIEPQEIVRSDGHDGTVVALPDGSRVEMRSNSELTLQPSADAMRINVTTGSIIVTAAKQRSGHLYVVTKDVTASVVGTVFVVSVEQAGSRVAVIEGEVQVEDGKTVKNLLPGQQVATNPLMPSIPLIKEISWSRHAQEYIAALRLSTAAVSEYPSTSVQALPEFGAVSIKPVSRDSRARTSGLSCHGTDGIVRALFGGTDPPTAPQGRCVGDRVRLSFLIALAYGVPQQYVSGGPDWARLTRDEFGLFQIEAVAENPSTATLAELRQMLQTMMTERFKLRIHNVVRPVPGYALVVARNGPKLKETFDGEESPFPVLNDKGGLAIKGKSTIAQLTPILTQFNSNREITPVVDKTRLSGRYDYEIVLPPPSAGQRGLISGSDLSDVLESQVGLRLRPEKSIPVEMIVIDQAEQPSPN